MKIKFEVEVELTPEGRKRAIEQLKVVEKFIQEPMDISSIESSNEK